VLGPILLTTELLRLDFPGLPNDGLELIQTSAKRGADMVKQLLTFVKGTEGERLLVQTRQLFRELEKLVRASFPKQIELGINCANDVRAILGDATQLQQVLLNLCVNARDAMRDGGRLTLTAENIELDTAAANALSAKPGCYVAWRIMDTGTGIPSEILERIFEPFFSTKGPEKGTGLGLSTVSGIIKSHGGFIQVSSVLGQGSTFTVCLPVAALGDGVALPIKNTVPFRGNGQTVLVVDDDATIRNFMRTVLTRENFKVLTALDAASALILVTEHQADLRVVITDQHMPNMDGLAFARVLKAKLPGAGIIVVSGKMDMATADEFKDLGVVGILEKPFNPEQLLKTLEASCFESVK
jgi:CheY-like chemotaxis protein